MIRYKSQAFLSRTGKLCRDTGRIIQRAPAALIVFVYRKIAEDRPFRETLRFLIADGSRFPELVDRHYDEFMRPVIDQFRMVIEAGVAAGEFRPSQASTFTEIVDSPALLLTVWSLLFGTRRQIDVAVFTDASIDLLDARNRYVTLARA